MSVAPNLGQSMWRNVVNAGTMQDADTSWIDQQKSFLHVVIATMDNT